MDLNYVRDKMKAHLQEKCPKVPDEILEEFLDLTFWFAHWATYGDNQDIYIIGLAENKYDFYYVGCDDNYEIHLISCALEVKRNEKRECDFITKFNRFNIDLEIRNREADCIWQKIRDNLKSYFEKNPQDKLLYFNDRLLSDEHFVVDESKNVTIKKNNNEQEAPSESE